MAFTQLTQLTQQKYDSLNLAFSRPPDSSTIGTPDPRATILLGGWASETLMAFRIVTAAGAKTSLSVDPSLADTLDISVSDDINPDSATTYYSVDVGSDSRSTDWLIDFQVSGSRGTGTWKFTKGKSEDDQY